VVDRRDFYWENLAEFDPTNLCHRLLKQFIWTPNTCPKAIHVPIDLKIAHVGRDADRRAGHKVEIFTPQRGSSGRSWIW